MEDDARVAANVRTGLERAGFDVDITQRGDEAVAVAVAFDYDAIAPLCQPDVRHLPWRN